MDYEQIAYEVADGVVTITLDRPDKLNAFTEQMMRELIDAFDRSDADDDVRAVGVGVTMTLPMDIRLASENAKIGFVFARRGIVPEAASSWYLPRVVGISRAMEWAATGRIFPASEALEGGL